MFDWLSNMRPAVTSAVRSKDTMFSNQWIPSSLDLEILANLEKLQVGQSKIEESLQRLFQVLWAQDSQESR